MQETLALTFEFKDPVGVFPLGLSFSGKFKNNPLKSPHYSFPTEYAPCFNIHMVFQEGFR